MRMRMPPGGRPGVDRDEIDAPLRDAERNGGGETIGALIARVRGERGITQLRLAERLCASAGVTTVTRNEISRWEREERIPSGYWLDWLAVVLEVPLGQLEPAAAAARRRRRVHASGAPEWSEPADVDVQAASYRAAS